MRLLFYCLALAAGEFTASQTPNFAETWPMFAVAALIVVLFGYGYDFCFWPYLALALFGVALFLFSSVANERLYREKPWMRGRRQHEQTEKSRTVGNMARCELSRRVAIGLRHDPDAAALNRAILLGERRTLPWRTRRVFVESGTMHVFAISGLHVMAVAKVLAVMAAVAFVPRRLAGVVAIPLLWGYVYMIGWCPSAVRAAMMASFYFSAPLFWRKPNGLTSWSITFLIVHLHDPLMIGNVGCALSFAVMLTILLVGEWTREMSGWRAMVWMSLSAWAAGVPIAAHVFGRVTPGGILGNLALITVAECTVACGVSGLAVSFVSETVATHINNLSALFTRTMVIIAEMIANLPYANYEAGKWSLVQCFAWYAALVLIFLLRGHLRKYRRHIL